MVVQVKVSGDPRRPNELHKFQLRPRSAEDQVPGTLLLLSIGFGMAAMLFKIKAMSWGAILCILMCVANVNSADLDLKSIMSASSMAFFGLVTAYLAPPARRV